jgi:hypothetical protein
MKTITITDEAYEYVRKMAFDTKGKIGATASKAILNNVEEDSK